MKAGWTATRLALPTFLLPFLFTYGPALLGRARALEILMAAVSGFIGVCCIASGVTGFLLLRVPMWMRFIMIPAGFSLIHTGGITDILGLITIGLCVLHQYASYTRANPKKEWRYRNG
jgi:TRAP-type uncharacterized transport system fused permease subunit